MNIKRAIGVSIATYVLSFIIGLVSMIVIDWDATQMADLPPSFFIIGIVISVILAALFSLVYFRDKSVKPNAKEGLALGLVLAITGFILDVILFSLGAIASDAPIEILAYYSNPMFWLALLLVVVTTTIVGAVKGKK